MFRVSKEFHFEAAHSLPHLPPDHKCARVHGHSYRVEVVLESATLDERSFAAVDYAELDEFGQMLDQHYDHRDLNEVMGGGHNTTAENLARAFFHWCKGRWWQTVAVRVYETAKTCVEYRE